MFTIASRKENIQEKNLTEEIKVLYMETMTLMNKTEDDTNKWKDNIVLESILLK